jgi:peptidoglycan/LPS O-acetylase OafA/YrhL
MDQSMGMEMGGHDMGAMNGDMGMGHGMDMGGMSMDSGPLVLGMHLDIFLMVAAGIFYIICAFFVWRTWKKEKTELVGALLAFLVYQAVSMFFMGLDMQTKNMLYGNIAGAAVIIGTAYMLKFPISRLSEKARRVTFLVLLVASLGLFAWFMQSAEKQTELMSFVLWYDLIANGIIVGGSILLFGLKASERSLKRKALGGGTGVASCCIAANGFMIAGSMIASSVFAFLAPIFILFSLKSAKAGMSSSAATTPAPAPVPAANPGMGSM